MDYPRNTCNFFCSRGRDTHVYSYDQLLYKLHGRRTEPTDMQHSAFFPNDERRWPFKHAIIDLIIFLYSELENIARWMVKFDFCVMLFILLMLFYEFEAIYWKCRHFSKVKVIKTRIAMNGMLHAKTPTSYIIPCSN